MSIPAFLVRNGYQSIGLSLETSGPYTAKDSEWNYSDIPHLNYIHTRVEGYTISVSRRHISNVFLQKIGPFTLPASVSILHEQPEVHEYVMTVLNIVIHVNTTHIQKINECLTTTDYRFYFKGLLGLIVCRLARRATRNNYKVLMSEDRPMRLQRGALRQRGISFGLDKRDIVGFSDTQDITLNHVDASASPQSKQAWSASIVGSVGNATDHDHLLQLAWLDNRLQIFPLICPHEGADLSGQLSKQDCSPKQAIMCPWHGRAIKSLLEISLLSCDRYRFNFCNFNLVLEVAPNAVSGGPVVINIFPETP